MTLEFTGIGGHHSNRAQTDEWLTPPFILDALGGWESFDLDPCTPNVQPWPTAKQRFTRADNGLTRAWAGRVWLNPPYYANVIGKWLARLAEHGHGSTIIFARTETVAFFDHVWDRAAGLLFLRGRLNFHHRDGVRASANSGAPSVLVAYGQADLDILSSCGLEGQFVPLRFPRALLAIALGPLSWRDEVVAWLKQQDGPVRLDAIYQAFAAHPKTACNPNWRAKIRQTLQRAAERTGPGEWRAAA